MVVGTERGRVCKAGVANEGRGWGRGQVGGRGEKSARWWRVGAWLSERALIGGSEREGAWPMVWAWLPCCAHWRAWAEGGVANDVGVAT